MSLIWVFFKIQIWPWNLEHCAWVSWTRIKGAKEIFSHGRKTKYFVKYWPLLFLYYKVENFFSYIITYMTNFKFVPNLCNFKAFLWLGAVDVVPLGLTTHLNKLGLIWNPRQGVQYYPCILEKDKDRGVVILFYFIKYSWKFHT